MDLFGFKKRAKIEAEREEIIEEISDLRKRIDKEKEAESSAYLQSWDKTQERTGRSPIINYRQLEWFYRKESWVRAAVDAIQRTSVSNGFRLVATADDIALKEKEIAPILKIFEKPNVDDTFADIVSEIIVDLHLYGDAYVEVVKDKKTKLPIGLFNVYAPSIRILVNKTGRVLGYLQISSSGGAGTKPVFFSPEEIVHFKLPNPGNEVYGLSPLESLSLPLETDIHAQIYNKTFFENNATPRLHLDLGNCSLPQLKRMREYVRSEFKGSKNAHKTFVTEGGATLQVIGTSSADMEFLNQRKFSRDEILAVFGVPPMKVGITEDVNRASALESDKSFKSDKIIPLQRMISNKINLCVVSLFNNPRVKFEFSELDLRDAKEQSQIDKIDLESGVMTVNEVRKRRGLQPLPDTETQAINDKRKEQGLAPLIFGENSTLQKIFTF